MKVLLVSFSKQDGSVQNGNYTEKRLLCACVFWRIADSLNSIGNPKFYVNQRSVRERFISILTRYKTKISAEVRATGIEVKEKTSTKNLLEELNEKIKEGEA